MDFVVFAGLSLILVMLLSLAAAGTARLKVARTARFYWRRGMGLALVALIPAILPGIERFVR